MKFRPECVECQYCVEGENGAAACEVPKCVEQLQSDLAALKELTGWILVGERLPKRNVKVEALYPNDYVMFCSLDQFEQWWNDSGSQGVAPLKWRYITLPGEDRRPEDV